mmetsp:Transcript_2795/g.9437  ORF Transcript_2795/g.9437 Transcript_2795/m.9437 type:complete len:206 (+) Transcript_2795:195-812(+)
MAVVYKGPRMGAPHSLRKAHAANPTCGGGGHVGLGPLLGPLLPQRRSGDLRLDFGFRVLGLPSPHEEGTQVKRSEHRQPLRLAPSPEHRLEHIPPPHHPHQRHQPVLGSRGGRLRVPLHRHRCEHDGEHGVVLERLQHRVPSSVVPGRGRGRATGAWFGVARRRHLFAERPYLAHGGVKLLGCERTLALRFLHLLLHRLQPRKRL